MILRHMLDALRLCLGGLADGVVDARVAYKEHEAALKSLNDALESRRTVPDIIVSDIGQSLIDATDRGREYERKAILDHIRTLAFDRTDDLVEQIENGRHRNK